MKIFGGDMSGAAAPDGDGDTLHQVGFQIRAQSVLLLARYGRNIFQRRVGRRGKLGR